MSDNNQPIMLTPELRKTFIKYGFESIHGREGVDEVLEKEIDLTL